MIIYKGMETRLTGDFAQAMLNTRTQQSNIITVLRNSVLNPAAKQPNQPNCNVRWNGIIKTVSRHRDFIIYKTSLKEP